MDPNKIPISRLTNGKGQGGVKTEKRSAHNLIEKRYRTSINDKIVELKDLVCGPDAKVRLSFSKTIKMKFLQFFIEALQFAERKKTGTLLRVCVILMLLPLFFKMNKAGVLRKAIEVIMKLQNENARLKQENMSLKMAQQKRGKDY